MTDDLSPSHARAPVLRSVLFVPGDKPRALDKAQDLKADALIIDLEDAVAPERKPEARLNALEAAARYKAHNLFTVLRIAEPGSPDLSLDLQITAQSQPDAVLIAKLEDPEQLHAVRNRLDEVGYLGPLWAMIETPRGVFNVEAIARQAQLNRLEALVAGANDLAEGLRLPEGQMRRRALEPHLARLVLAARATGLAVLDAVYNAYADEAGLEAEARHGRGLGFDGKTLIHPAQISPVHRAFAPTPSELDWARTVVDAFDDPAHAGKGAVPIKGRMIELMHLRTAKALLAAAKT